MDAPCWSVLVNNLNHFIGFSTCQISFSLFPLKRPTLQRKLFLQKKKKVYSNHIYFTIFLLTVFAANYNTHKSGVEILISTSIAILLWRIMDNLFYVQWMFLLFNGLQFYLLLLSEYRQNVKINEKVLISILFQAKFVYSKADL